MLVLSIELIKNTFRPCHVCHCQWLLFDWAPGQKANQTKGHGTEGQRTEGHSDKRPMDKRPIPWINMKFSVTLYYVPLASSLQIIQDPTHTTRVVLKRKRENRRKYICIRQGKALHDLSGCELSPSSILSHRYCYTTTLKRRRTSACLLILV